MRIKCIVLIMALIIMLSLCLSSAVASAITMDTAGLIGIIINGNSDIPVTRVDLAKIAIQISDASLINEGKAHFIDVPEKHEFFPIVNTVYLHGLMVGKTENEFRPSENASVSDATRMLLSVLGYSDFLHDMNAKQINNLVRSTKLLSGVGDGVLTERKLSRMIDNLGDAKSFSFVGISGGEAIYGESGETLLETLGYKSIQGVVNAVEHASINKYAAVSENEIMVDGNIYTYDGFDMLPYLGQKVRIIVDMNADDKIVSIRTEGTSNEIKIDANDILEYEGYQYTYLNEGRKRKTAKITTATRIVLNGVNITSYGVNNMVPLSGSVVIRDIDGNGTNDLVIIESAMIFKISSIKNKCAFTDSYTNESFDAEKIEVDLIKNGALISTEQLNKGDYLRVMPDKIEYKTLKKGRVFTLKNASYIRAEIVDPTIIYGEVTAMQADEIDISIEENGNSTVKSYEYSDYISTLMNGEIVQNVKLGSSGSFFIDDKGLIIDFEIEAAISRINGFKYGYLLQAGKEQRRDAIRIVNEEAKEETLILAKKAKINGRKISLDDLKVEEQSKTTNTKLYNSDGSIKRQLVTYKLNSEGEISNLYLAIDYAHEFILDQDSNNTDVQNPDYRKAGYEGYDYQNFSLDFSTNKTRKLFRNVVEGTYSFSNDSVIFIVPQDPEKIKNYKVSVTGNSLLSYDSEYHYRIYDVDENFKIGALIIDNSIFKESVGDSIRSLETADISLYGINALPYVYYEDEDDYLKSLEYIELTPNSVVSEPGRVSIGDGTLKDTDELWYKEWTNRPGQLAMGNRLLSEVRPGDILRIRINEDGGIKAFAVIFAYDQLTAADGAPAYDLYTTYAKSGTTMVALCKVSAITPEGKVVCCYSNEYDYTKLLVGTPKNVVKYTDGYGFEKMTVDDIAVGDIVVVHGQNGQFRNIFIYE